jgi:hypothetical protein
MRAPSSYKFCSKSMPGHLISSRDMMKWYEEKTWLMVLCLPGRDSISKAHIPSSPFSPGYFGARSYELFAQADLQSWSSWLTLSNIRITDLSHWQLACSFLEILVMYF